MTTDGGPAKSRYTCSSCLQLADRDADRCPNCQSPNPYASPSIPGSAPPPVAWAPDADNMALAGESTPVSRRSVAGRQRPNAGRLPPGAKRRRLSPGTSFLIPLDAPPALLATTARRFASYFLNIALSVVTLWVGWVIWWIFAAKEGQNPAYVVLGLRAVGPDGLPPRRRCMLVRDLAGYAASFATFGVAGLWLVRDPNRQALHDRAFGTTVVRTATPGGSAPPAIPNLVAHPMRIFISLAVVGAVLPLLVSYAIGVVGWMLELHSSPDEDPGILVLLVIFIILAPAYLNTLPSLCAASVFTGLAVLLLVLRVGRRLMGAGAPPTPSEGPATAAPFNPAPVPSPIASPRPGFGAGPPADTHAAPPQEPLSRTLVMKDGVRITLPPDYHFFSAPTEDAPERIAITHGNPADPVSIAYWDYGTKPPKALAGWDVAAADAPEFGRIGEDLAANPPDTLASEPGPGELWQQPGWPVLNAAARSNAPAVRREPGSRRPIRQVS